MNQLMKALLLIIFVMSSNAQVMLIPPAVFIDPIKKTGNMGVKNTSTDPREATFSFQFGYVKYDSSGNPYMEYNDTLWEAKHSLVPYIKVFPKKIIIPPNQEQKVRFMVTHPDDLPDGVYWTRLFVQLDPVEQQVDTVKEGIVAGLVVSTQIVGAVMYRKGKMDAAIDIPEMRVINDDKELSLLFAYQKMGTSPFLGSITIKVFDSKKKLIQELPNRFCVVYTDGQQRFALDKNLFPKGDYTTLVEVHAKRDDIPQSYWPEFKTLKKTFNFTIY